MNNFYINCVHPWSHRGDSLLCFKKNGVRKWTNHGHEHESQNDERSWIHGFVLASTTSYPIDVNWLIPRGARACTVIRATCMKGLWEFFFLLFSPRYLDFERNISISKNKCIHSLKSSHVNLHSYAFKLLF